MSQLQLAAHARQAIHSHHEQKRDELRQTHADFYQEFESVHFQLEALANEMHYLTEQGVSLDANFSKFGYDAHLSKLHVRRSFPLAFSYLSWYNRATRFSGDHYLVLLHALSSRSPYLLRFSVKSAKRNDRDFVLISSYRNTRARTTGKLNVTRIIGPRST